MGKTLQRFPKLITKFMIMDVQYEVRWGVGKEEEGEGVVTK